MQREVVSKEEEIKVIRRSEEDMPRPPDEIPEMELIVEKMILLFCNLITLEGGKGMRLRV
tara:strand:- start:492 stop:671 length:180 start_codon:yes stop_codon:yes gene_type:complete